MEALKAEETLQDGKPKTPDEIKRLIRAATGSEDAAEDAWAKAAFEEMR